MATIYRFIVENKESSGGGGGDQNYLLTLHRFCGKEGVFRVDPISWRRLHPTLSTLGVFRLKRI